jgi:hypothetical protein
MIMTTFLGVVCEKRRMAIVDFELGGRGPCTLIMIMVTAAE